MTAAGELETRLPSLEIPAIRELAGVDQWVCHQDKVPKQPSGLAGSTTNSDTWSTFESCYRAVVSGGYSGVGFVFTSQDDYVGVDFDHVLDTKGKVKDPSIAEWVAELSSYTEISPSGDGLHCILKGTIPSAVKTRAVEIYSQGRYFTVTGRHYPGTPESINWSVDLPVSDQRERLDRSS